MNYKVGNIFKHKKHYLIVKKGTSCSNCFFVYEKYPYTADVKETKICYRPKSVKCSSISRDDYTDVYYEEISEIEVLILKGSD